MVDTKTGPWPFQEEEFQCLFIKKNAQKIVKRSAEMEAKVFEVL